MGISVEKTDVAYKDLSFFFCFSLSFHPGIYHTYLHRFDVYYHPRSSSIIRGEGNELRSNHTRTQTGRIDTTPSTDTNRIERSAALTRLY